MFRKIMSLYLIVSLFSGSLLPVTPTMAQEQTKNYRLAVIDLDPIGVSENETRALSDKLRSHISQLMREKVGLKFTSDILERAQIDRILDEHQLKTTGCVSDSCAVEFGKILQADRIVIGSVSLIGQTYSVIVRIVDVETSRTIDSSDRSFKGSIDALITKIIPEVGNDLFLVPSKKSRTKWYILAGVMVIGGIGAGVLGGSKEEGQPEWLPDPPSKP